MIGRKILIFMLIASLGMGLAVFVMSYRELTGLYDSAVISQKRLSKMSSEESRSALLSETESMLFSYVQDAVRNDELIFSNISKDMDSISKTLTRIYKNERNFSGHIPPLPHKTANGVAQGRGAIVSSVEPTDELIEEQKLLSNIEYYAASVYENEPQLRMILLGTESGIFYRYSNYNTYSPDYDPRSRNWYKAAMENPDEVVWSKAYIEMYGNYVVTCSETFRDETGKIAGVIAADISIQSIVDSIIRTDSAFIIDKDGDYVARPDNFDDTFIAPPSERGSKERYKTIEKMLAGESGVDSIQTDREPKYIAYAPINETGWALGIVVTFDTVTKPVKDTQEKMNRLLISSNDEMTARMDSLKMRFNVIFAICIVLITAISYILASSIKRPIEHLVVKAREIGQGKLDTNIEVKGKDEIAELGNSFNKMTDDLKKYIESLSEALEERHKVEAELNIAAKIQMSMLPDIAPDYTGKDEYELFASMNPAKEVGGDFYDFFGLDDSHLALVIADVSGKGVPAALFMAITKALIKTNAKAIAGSDIEVDFKPADILMNVNNQLCESNKTDMFTTAWLGIVDINTGHMRCANAGHEFPIIKSGSGQFEIMKDVHGFVLAGMEGTRYKEYTIDLEKDDILFVYTDGVPEAQNINEEFYGTDRLVNALNSIDELTPENILAKVKEDVNKFVDNAPQFDDLTMLCFKRK